MIIEGMCLGQSQVLLSQRFPPCVSNHNAYPHDSQKLKLSKLYLKEKI